jgi:general secretion pathway protein G
MKLPRENTGFTLIELMIVIGIVGTLIATTTLAYGNYLKDTRDAKRKLDLEEIRLSLEKYRTNTSTYPEANEFSLIQTEGYIAEIPEDPLSPQQSYTYEYDSTQDMYQLSAELENDSQGQYYIVKPNGSTYRDSVPNL